MNRLCLCGYMWRLSRPWPHRLRMRISVVAGLAREVSERLRERLGVRPRTSNRAEVVINRPQDIVVVAEALACPEHVLSALKDYASSHEGTVKGLPVTPERRRQQTMAAFTAMQLRPPPPPEPKRRYRRARSLSV